MNLRELDYICAVERFRHFGKAAQHCNVSQPTLSSQILKLEAKLGVTIFERIRGAARLTSEGEAIIKAAQRARQAVSDIKSLAKEFNDPFTGDFSLGVIPTIGPFLLPLFSGTLLQQYPDLKLSYIEDTTDRLNNQLLAGHMDAAIMATLPIDPTLAHIPLYDEDFHVALSKNNPLSQKESLSTQDLEKLNLLLLTEGHCLRDQALAVCSAPIQNESILATSLDTLLGLVAGGHGTTLIPTLSIRTGCISELGLVVRPISDPMAYRRVNLTYRKSHVRPQLLDALIKLIRSELPSRVRPVDY